MDAAEREARRRVEAVYAAIDRLGPEALSSTPLPELDHEDRTIRLNALEVEADIAGRGPLLDEARAWLRDALAQRIVSRGRRPESGVWGVSDIGRAEDIAAMLTRLDDAVAVAVAEDLVDPADAAALANPGRAVLGLAPLPDWPSALPPDARSRPPEEPAPPAWEPSAADWAASEDGGASEVQWRWWKAPHEASQGRLLSVVVITGAGAMAGMVLFGLVGLLAVGGLAAGVGWLLIGIPRQEELDSEDLPGDEPGRG